MKEPFNIIKTTIVVNVIYLLVQAFRIYIHSPKIKFTTEMFYEQLGMLAAFIFFSYLVIAKIHTHIMEKQEVEEESTQD